jgi:putative acetyltransferase
MTTQFAIRRAVLDDYGVIADVMFDAVRHGRSHYSEEQRQAWVPHRLSGSAWIERLNSQSIFAAEISGQINGFMSLAENGYIDFAYIRPSAQGTGMFRRLYQAIEHLAMQTGEPRLWVHASLMAQPAFAPSKFLSGVTEIRTRGSPCHGDVFPLDHDPISCRGSFENRTRSSFLPSSGTRIPLNKLVDSAASRRWIRIIKPSYSQSAAVLFRPFDSMHLHPIPQSARLET